MMSGAAAFATHMLPDGSNTTAVGKSSAALSMVASGTGEPLAAR
ncbi:MAG: hypothetical protein WBY93_11285 [Candidatus Binatus sp.]